MKDNKKEERIKKTNTNSKKEIDKKSRSNKQNEKTKGNYLLGIIGAIIGGFIGAVPWVLAYIYGNMMIALLAIFIAGGAFYGYKIFRGKVNKKVPIIIMITSLIIVAIVSVVIIPIILLYTEGWNVNIETIQYLFKDSEFKASIIQDTVIAIIFTAIGAGIITANIKKEIEEGSLTKTEQSPENFNKIKEEAIEKIKPIFEKYNALSKEHTIEKIELEVELEQKNIDITLLKTLQTVEIVKKVKGRYFYDIENENKDIKPKKQISKSNIIAIIVTIIAIIAVVIIIAIGQSKKNSTKEVTDGVVSFEINSNWIEYTNYYAGGWNYYKYISNFPIKDSNEIDTNEIDYSSYPAYINVTYFDVDKNEYSSIENIKNSMIEYINSAEEVPELESEIIKTNNGYEVLKMKLKYNTEPTQIEYMYYLLNGDTMAAIDAYTFNINDEEELQKNALEIVNSFKWLQVEVNE